MGAIVPLLRCFFVYGAPGVLASLGTSAAGLFAIVADITLHQSPRRLLGAATAGLRPMGAAVASFGVGRLVGCCVN